ncbi:MAG: lytic transglycosylase domain-containing protein [Ruminococcus sp.]|nr:lytic transglycosylase domain-containing protein [Ruminococcus sp.]
MAAVKSKSKKKKKKAGGGHTGLIVIISLILAILIVLAFIFRDQISEKIRDYGPNVFMTTDYEEYVIKYSNEYEMDPRFVFAIINTESHFNPDATSNVGARGLMQLMEEAYDWVKFRMGDERTHTFDDMYDPELNIQYGTFMLKFLYDKFDNSYELTAAAYHGGMNAVDTWIKDGTIDPDNFRLEDVPSDVTANYIYKVMNAYNRYKEKLQEDLKNG